MSAQMTDLLESIREELLTIVELLRHIAATLNRDAR